VVTLGITGGLGAGKSTACQRLKERGAVIFDADSVAKEILLTVPEVQEQISDVFGINIQNHGNLDFGKLANIAFSNEENQTALNNIIHPYVIKAFEKKREETEGQDGLLVIDAPLIFESGLDSHLDYTVLIYSTYKIRIARAIRRGNLSREQILKRMELQMSEEEKRKLASFVIENNGPVDQLYQKVDSLFDKLVG